jgi:hypothetical protein
LIVGALALAYLVWLIVQGESLSGITDLLGVALSLAWIVWVVFDRWAWRWPGVSKIAGSRPDIAGTWRGSLASEWVDPSTRNGIPPDPEVYLVVRETFSTVSAQLLTRESKSETIAGTIDRNGVGTSLIGVYRNVPRSAVRDRSAIHYGALILDVEGSPPGRLDGRYWTDRHTAGELRLDSRTRGIVHGYEAARQLDW